MIEILLREETSIARVKFEYETVTVSKFSPFRGLIVFVISSTREEEANSTRQKKILTREHTLYIFILQSTGGHVTPRTNPTIRRTRKLDGNCRTIAWQKLEIVSFAMV